MTNKEKYVQLCVNENYTTKIHLFAQPFWLDKIAENWDVCLHEHKNRIVAALPYCWKGKLLTKRIYLPDFNFYQSVIFFDVDDSAQQQEIIYDLFQQLPKTIKSYFKFLPEYFDIDLSKLNYQKKNYCTYIINKNQHQLNLSTNHKRNIQKGIKQQYLIEESKNVQQSFFLLTSTFARQQLKSRINFNEFEKINQLAQNHHCGKILDCIDSNKNLLASAFIVEDSNMVYYLFGGYNVEYKNSGAMTFLLYSIIKNSLIQKKDFNFCGSSKKSIATYFEGFGVKKTNIGIWEKYIF